MHEGKRATNEAIAQPGKPTAAFLRERLDIAAHGIDEHHLAHALEHRLPAGEFVPRFCNRLAHELRDPIVILDPLQVKQPRQRGDQWIEGSHIPAQEAAYQGGPQCSSEAISARASAPSKCNVKGS
jgi:hypothetical protein